MTERNQRSDKAVEKILAGTMHAIGRQGKHRLSVADICEASGVSRGTFYRYFTGKDAVLEVLGRHFEDGAAEAFTAALAANPDPASRVQVVLDTIIAYRSAAHFPRMLDVTPEFTLEFLSDTFPKLTDVVTEALGPAAEHAPLVVNGSLTKRQLGELFLRSVMSMLFLPGGRSDQVPRMVASLMRVDAPSQTRQRSTRPRAKGR